MHPVKRARLNRLVKYAVHQMATKQALDWGSVWGTVTRPEVLAGVGGALAGGGLGAALPRIFMKDKKKAKKWMLLSALLGAMAGASGGVGAVYGYRALFPGKVPEPAPTPPKSEAKSEAPAPKPKSEVKPYTPEEMWSEPGSIEIAGMPEWMREQQTYPWLDTPMHGEYGEEEILNDMKRRELVQTMSPLVTAWGSKGLDKSTRILSALNQVQEYIKQHSEPGDMVAGNVPEEVMREALKPLLKELGIRTAPPVPPNVQAYQRFLDQMHQALARGNISYEDFEEWMKTMAKLYKINK